MAQKESPATANATARKLRLMSESPSDSCTKPSPARPEKREYPTQDIELRHRRGNEIYTCPPPLCAGLEDLVAAMQRPLSAACSAAVQARMAAATASPPAIATTTAGPRPTQPSRDAITPDPTASSPPVSMWRWPKPPCALPLAS